MSITAKELASILGISQTAVSMALHNKPGVSTDTRKKVIKTAEQYGFDFTKIQKGNELEGTIYIIQYISNNAILSYSPIFSELTEGVTNIASQNHLRVKLLQIHEKTDDLDRYLEDLRVTDCIGIILVGTETSETICRKFTSLNIPVVLLDSYFENLNCDSVLINNEAGAYFATDYVISRTGKQPGYIRSTYRIPNFEERLVGYKKAIRSNGFSVSRSIIHEVSPSFDGAFSDMLGIMEEGNELAGAYICENDIIAIGVIKALKLRGYRIPEDIAVMGFDNISESKIVEPSLSTIDVPRHFMAEYAARQLLFRLKNHNMHPIKIAVSPSVIKRFSV